MGEKIDVTKVPVRKLYTGAIMPAMGLGNRYRKLCTERSKQVTECLTVHLYIRMRTG